MTEVLSGPLLLPPPLIHDLRARAFQRIDSIADNPGNRGLGGYLRRQIAAAVARQGFTVEKAISVAYLGSFLVDHITRAEKEAVRKMEAREMTEGEEHRFWESQYSAVLSRLLKEVPGGSDIKKMLARLPCYSALPVELHFFREHHWRALDRWHRGQCLTGSRQVMLHINHALESRRTPYAKARAVALAASLLADIECWLESTAWTDAYRHVMTDLYPAIARQPEVLEAIVS